MRILQMICCAARDAPYGFPENILTAEIPMEPAAPCLRP